MSSVDPRGPLVQILKVERSPTGGPVVLTLSCGHVVNRVNHFSYREGDDSRCFTCRKNADEGQGRPLS